MSYILLETGVVFGLGYDVLATLQNSCRDLYSDKVNVTCGEIDIQIGAKPITLRRNYNEIIQQCNTNR